MGQYVNGNKVVMEGTIDIDNLKRELAALIGVAPREEGTFAGRIVSSDICVNSHVNMWARCKSEDIDKEWNITEEDRRANGYGLAIHMNTLDTSGELDIYPIWGIERLPITGNKRIKDFNGYHHTTRSQLQLSQDSVTAGDGRHVNVHTGECPDGVPFDRTIEMMWENADEYNQHKIDNFDEFGYMVLSYSGFVKKLQYISDSFDGLRSELQGTGPQYQYATYEPFLREPKGTEGKLFIYGKEQDGSYTQLLPACKIKKAGTKHPISIDWTPQMTIGTLKSGKYYIVKDWLRGEKEGVPIMFGTDDNLYFGFTIRNNGDATMYGGALSLTMIVDGGKMYRCRFLQDNSDAVAGSFSVPSGGELGPASDGTPRFYVMLSSLINESGVTLGDGQIHDVTFGIWYSENNLGPLLQSGYDDGYLVTEFSLPMQCTGNEVDGELKPPSDITPPPPTWDTEIEDY